MSQPADNWPLVGSARREVFISHAVEDVDIAFRVAANLRRYLDLEVHVDESFLRPTQSWRSEIESRIDNSELLIVLQSRVVEGGLAPGVLDEIERAQARNIPVVIGCIRGRRPAGSEQAIDFGEDGGRIDAMWSVAKFLLSESHPFRVLGLDSIHADAASASRVLGTAERMAARAVKVSIFGHTMKNWLGDYGNAIRHTSASIEMTFPASDAIGMDLLVAGHRNGRAVVREIERAKASALELEAEFEQSDPGKFRCFCVPVKPILSYTCLDLDTPRGIFVIDYQSYLVGSDNRPKMIIQGRDTVLFKHFARLKQAIDAISIPLRDERNEK